MTNFKDVLRWLAGRPEAAAAEGGGAGWAGEAASDTASPVAYSPAGATTAATSDRGSSRADRSDGRSDRLARLGLAPGAGPAAGSGQGGGHGSATLPAGDGAKGSSGSMPDPAPKPTFRRDVGLGEAMVAERGREGDGEVAPRSRDIGNDEPGSGPSDASPSERSPSEASSNEAPPTDARPTGTTTVDEKPTGAAGASHRPHRFMSSAHKERERDRKRATYRLPTPLLSRLRAAARRTGRYQYMIVIDALRAYLPRLENEALDEVGPSLTGGERRASSNGRG